MLLMTVLFVRHFSLQTSLVLAALKTAVFVLLWDGFAAGTLQLPDGLAYFEDSRAVLTDYTPLSLVLTEGGRGLLDELAAHGPHKLYHWWNVTLLSITDGEPTVLLAANVFFSAVLAVLVGAIARAVELPRDYGLSLIVFLLFFPNVVVWSSMTNMKDTMVSMLIVLVFFGLIRLQLKLSLIGVISVVAALGLLMGLRYYVVVFLVVSAIGGGFLTMGYRLSARYVLTILVCATGIVAVLGMDFLLRHISRLDLTAIPIGAAQFLLTPRPWGLREPYEFLLIPAIYHWVCFPVACIGFFLLWRDVPGSRMMLIFGTIVVLFYAAEESLRGPRQRLQLDFLFGWAQFHVLYVVTLAHARRRRSSSQSATPPVLS